jgi:hypothetical protein
MMGYSRRPMTIGVASSSVRRRESPLFQTLFHLGQTLDQPLVKRLDFRRGQFAVKGQSSLQDADLFDDALAQLEDVFQVSRMAGQEIGIEESLLVFSDSAHDAGVDDALESHAERIDVPARFGGVQRGQLLQFAIDRQDRLASVLDRSDFFDVAVDHLEPAQNSRQSENLKFPPFYFFK